MIDAIHNSVLDEKRPELVIDRSREITPLVMAKIKNKNITASAIQFPLKSERLLTAVIPLVDKIDIAKIKLSKPGKPETVKANQRTPVSVK